MEMELQAGEHRVLACAGRSLTLERPWLVEFYVRYRGEWEILDTVALDDLDADGCYRDSDGDLSLRYADYDDDGEELPDAFVVDIPSAEIERLLLFVADKLRLKATPRVRLSALAERRAA